MAKETRVIEEKTTEWLKYVFSEDEITDMSKDMAKETIRAKNLDEQKKAVTSDLKAQIDAAQLQANSLARKIQDGSEYRNIDCKKILDFKTGMATIVRIDTGETVNHRKMNAGEKQMTISGYMEESKDVPNS